MCYLSAKWEVCSPQDSVWAMTWFLTCASHSFIEPGVRRDLENPWILNTKSLRLCVRQGPGKKYMAYSNYPNLIRTQRNWSQNQLWVRAEHSETIGQWSNQASTREAFLSHLGPRWQSTLKDGHPTGVQTYVKGHSKPIATLHDEGTWGINEARASLPTSLQLDARRQGSRLINTIPTGETLGTEQGRKGWRWLWRSK